MDRVRNDPRDGVRDDAHSYGVDTIRLRISFPAAPVSQGYNGRMWRMRPLRGWTGGQAADAEPFAGAGQGGGYADGGAALPIANRVLAVSSGGAVPNAGGGATNVALNFDPNTQGFPVVLPDGSNVPDRNSPTGLLMSPYADASNVAERGRRTGATYFGMINSSVETGDPNACLVAKLALDLGHGGRFDCQRQDIPMLGDLTGWTQSRQFRDVANFNVGLYMQQAGFTLDETLSIAGTFASLRSDNKKPDQPYGLDAQTAEFIKIGYEAGAKGMFGPAVKPT